MSNDAANTTSTRLGRGVVAVERVGELRATLDPQHLAKLDDALRLHLAL